VAARDNGTARKNTDKAPRTDETPQTDGKTPATAEDETGRTWLVNHGTTPMVYDTEGRTVPAGGRVAVDEPDDAGRAAVERGYLSVEKTGPDGDTDAAKPEAGGHGESAGD